MATVLVPQADGQIIVFDGDKPHSYTVKDGALTVPDDHAASILVSVAGSSLKPEPVKAKPSDSSSKPDEKGAS